MTAEIPAHLNGRPTPPPSGPMNLSFTAELTALAAHLRRLADRVDDLESHCSELTAAVADSVLPQLAEHTTQVQQLLVSVKRDGERPVDWPAMDAERASTEWGNLADWIAHTLVPWYEITRDQLPDCWALHRPAVIQLAWLYDTYKAAHRPGAAPHLAAEWHTRWKPAALRAIHDAIPRRGTRTCGPGHHLTNETERIPRRPTSLPPPAAEPSATVPTDQLAEGHHWQPFYVQAVTSDLAIRREKAGGEHLK